MNKTFFFLIFFIKIFQIKTETLLINDDDLDSRYIHISDINPINVIEKNLKLEKKNFCSIDSKFIDNILFGLITDNHKLMKKCFDENLEIILRLTKALTNFIVYNITTKGLNDHKTINRYVAIRRAYFTVKQDYLYFIIKSMEEIEDICQPRMKNTLDDSSYAEQMAKSLAFENYEIAINNFKVLKVPALIISTLKFAMNWNMENMVQKAMTVVNALLKDDEMDAVSNMLLTIYGILLTKNQKYSYDSLIIAEMTKIALDKFGKIPITQPDYKPIRKKFKFIIVHLATEIRSLVWDIPKRQTNFCIKNKKSGNYLFVRDRQRQRKILTGKSITDSGKDFLTQSQFRISFNQTDFFYRIVSEYYKDSFLTHTSYDVQPERWIFIPTGDGSFFIKTESNEIMQKYLYLVEDLNGKDLPRDVKVIPIDLNKLNGGEKWSFVFCV